MPRRPESRKSVGSSVAAKTSSGAVELASHAAASSMPASGTLLPKNGAAPGVTPTRSAVVGAFQAASPRNAAVATATPPRPDPRVPDPIPLQSAAAPSPIQASTSGAIGAINLVSAHGQGISSSA